MVSPRVRVDCARCGPKVEPLRRLGPHLRVTRRLGPSVARPCKVASLLHVARHWDLNWKSVKALDRAYLEHERGLVDRDGVEATRLDEFANHKGHHDATVIAKPTRKRAEVRSWTGSRGPLGHSSNCSAQRAAHD